MRVIPHPFLRPKPILLLLLALLVLGGIGKYALHRRITFNNPEMMARDGIKYEQEGVMTRADLERLVSLDDQAINDDPLSVSDVDWLLAFSQRDGTEAQRIQRRQWTTGVLSLQKLHGFPASRTEQIFQFAVETLSYPDKSYVQPDPGGTLAVSACRLFSKLGDRRAIPYLTPLLSSNDSYLRRTARMVLYSINRTAPKTSRS